MARIAGVDLTDKDRIDYALTRIKGIGWTLSKKILGELKIEANRRVSDLSPDEVSKISSKMEDHVVEGDLLRQVRSNVQRLQVTGTYRGVRHSKGLPVHGQRTRTNARTKRGKRKTIGAFKKEMIVKQEAAKKGEPAKGEVKK